jgi:hypothetical protein
MTGPLKLESAYRPNAITITPKTAAAPRTIKASSPQINQAARRSCSGVGWVIPKKLINPFVMNLKNPTIS